MTSLTSTFFWLKYVLLLMILRVRRAKDTDSQLHCLVDLNTWSIWISHKWAPYLMSLTSWAMTLADHGPLRRLPMLQWFIKVKCPLYFFSLVLTWLSYSGFDLLGWGTEDFSVSDCVRNWVDGELNIVVKPTWASMCSPLSSICYLILCQVVALERKLTSAYPSMGAHLQVQRTWTKSIKVLIRLSGTLTKAHRSIVSLS